MYKITNIKWGLALLIWALPALSNLTSDPCIGSELDCRADTMIKTDPVPLLNQTWSGAYFDPDNSGQGIFIEFLDDNRILAAWFLYDNEGKQYWLTGLGGVQQNTIELTAYLTEGGFFPSMPPPQSVVIQEWGRVTLTFEDCNDGTLSWFPEIEGFDAGSHPITRLTSIATLNCTQELLKNSEDLNQMTSELIDLHPEPFNQIQQDEFESRTFMLANQLNALPDELIDVAFSELVALIGDSHTNVLIDDSKRFPLVLSRIDTGLIVSQSTGEYRSLLGSRIQSINGVDLEVIEQQLGRVISHENSAWLQYRSMSYMLIPKVLEYLNVISDSTEASFEVIDRFGVATDHVVKSVDSGQMTELFSVYSELNIPVPLYLQNEANYWFTYLQNSDILYFAYNQAVESSNDPFNDFLNRLSNTAFNLQPNKIVVDLRSNTGGNSALLSNWISTFAASNSPFNDPNRLFVIISQGTFSSGLLNAIQFDQTTQAQLVGLPTGGKPNHFGEVRNFRLNNSTTMVQYSTRRFETVSGDPDHLVPDVVLTAPTYNDFMNGVDPFFDYIEAL